MAINIQEVLSQGLGEHNYRESYIQVINYRESYCVNWITVTKFCWAVFSVFVLGWSWYQRWEGEYVFNKASYVVRYWLPAQVIALLRFMIRVVARIRTKGNLNLYIPQPNPVTSGCHLWLAHFPPLKFSTVIIGVLFLHLIGWARQTRNSGLRFLTHCYFWLSPWEYLNLSLLRTVMVITLKLAVSVLLL